jgi:hypothetical protein
MNVPLIKQRKGSGELKGQYNDEDRSYDRSPGSIRFAIDLPMESVIRNEMGFALSSDLYCCKYKRRDVSREFNDFSNNGKAKHDVTK